MRSVVGVVVGVVGAVVWSWVAWFVGYTLGAPLLPLQFLVVGLLTMVGLWLLAWRTPTPWWALSLAIVQFPILWLVNAIVADEPAEVTGFRAQRLAFRIAVYLVVVGLGSFAAWRGAIRRTLGEAHVLVS